MNSVIVLEKKEESDHETIDRVSLNRRRAI